jgi:putative PEP-CTERM system histidine kinase
VSAGFYSYLVAFLAYAILTTLLVFSWRGRALGGFIIAASAATAAWSGILMVGALFGSISFGAHAGAELLRDAAWCLFLIKVTGKASGDEGAVRAKAGLYTVFGIVLVLVSGALFLLPLASEYFRVSNERVNEAILATWIIVAICGLILVEQIFRNASTDERWAIKYLCIGVGGLFAYDFYMYSHALLFRQLDPVLWSARGIANAVAVPLIAASVARNPRYAIDIHVSRDVIFHSATVIGTGVYLLVMAFIGYYIRLYEGEWSRLLQTVFFFGAGLLLVVILFSGNIRSRLRVLLSKHFFSFKYDYRQEWLNFTNSLAVSGEYIPERIIRAIAAMIHSPGGYLWEKEGDAFRLLERWNCPEPDAMDNSKLASLGSFLSKTNWIVDLDEYSRDPGRYRDLELPGWLCAIPNAWLIIPLPHKTDVLGFVLIKRSDTVKGINWEDRDLLKLAGRQAASHLAQYQADQALLRARQFEAFNRLSAYVVHDLKNILAQQSLIVSNAEKHKHKPEFVDDVIHTIKNSVDRMTRLMEQMRGELRGSRPRDIDLVALLSEIVGKYARHQPAPVLEGGPDTVFVYADPDQLGNVFGHIVQNAIEATDKSGQVRVVVGLDDARVLVSVEDTGCGMDEEFIRERLFKPFDSTKGLTGMGIGAFESRDYIRSLGGDILVRSTPGQGTVFTVSLPVEARAEKERQTMEKG